MKANIRDLNTIIKDKDQLIEALKRNMKVTKLEETQKELEVYQTECLRLRGLLGEAENNIRRFTDQVSKLKVKLRSCRRKRRMHSYSPNRDYRSVSPPH